MSSLAYKSKHIKKEEKMKKNEYMAPEMEVVEIKLMGNILTTSENPGFGGDGDPDKDLD